MPEEVGTTRPYKHATANDIQVGGSHYKSKAVQHWDYAAQLPYLDGQVSKYVDRHQQKNKFQDLLKAEHYLHKMMEIYYSKEYAEHTATQGRKAALALLGITELEVLQILAHRGETK